MSNHWGTYNDAPAAWHVEFPPDLWQRWPDLLAFAGTVFELGLSEEVFNADEVPPASAREHNLFGDAAPSAYLSVFGSSGIEDRKVRDLGAELLLLRPELSRAPRVPALSVSGPLSLDRTQPVYVSISSPTDIWFPWVVGINEDPDDGSFDNRQLASRHTPRLNRFLAGVRAAAIELGGEWSFEANHRYYEGQMTEFGIVLDQAITVVRLVKWNDCICKTAVTDTEEMLRELGFFGKAVPNGRGFELESPPPGTRRIRSAGSGDEFEYFELEFEEPVFTQTDIESWFGAGKSVPRVHWDSNFSISYQIDHPNASHGCDMFAEFATEPTGDTPVTGILMRRRRAWR